LADKNSISSYWYGFKEALKPFLFARLVLCTALAFPVFSVGGGFGCQFLWVVETGWTFSFFMGKFIEPTRKKMIETPKFGDHDKV